jgi:hypothetical protein
MHMGYACVVHGVCTQKIEPVQHDNPAADQVRRSAGIAENLATRAWREVDFRSASQIGSNVFPADQAATIAWSMASRVASSARRIEAWRFL